MSRKRADEPFVMLPRSLLESYAWRALSRAARRVIDRIVIEHLAHAGRENGKLIVRYEDFIEYGIHPESIAPAQREACALGLIIMTERGRAGNAEYRTPHKWAVAFVKGKRGATASTWKRFQSLPEAKAVAAEARSTKDTNAVAKGKAQARRRAFRNKTPLPDSVVVSLPDSGGRNR
jgi:hypothetical protein